MSSDREPLYSLCPACAGTGVVQTAPHRACLSCRVLRVVEAGVTQGQVEMLYHRIRHAEDVLYSHADGCRKRMMAYGIAYPKSCEACGLGGQCLKENR